MSWRGHHGPRKAVAAWLLTGIAVLLAPTPGFASDKNGSKVPFVRWDESHPGCTFSSGQDGKYRYGLWTDEIGITMAVDAQELEKVHRRHEPFFAILLTVHYRGPASLDLTIDHISLEFERHYHVKQIALDPDDFSDRVQNDADSLNDQASRQVEKHPDQKQAREATVRGFLKDAAELEEFVGKNSLRPTKLSPGHEETTGWVLFSTNSKWIGKWKKQENMVLRIPTEGKVFEFPFHLPPKPGETILRKRE